MLHKKLENLRVNKDWSKTTVAKKLGIGLSTYHGYESGKTFPRDFTILLKLAKLYEVSLDYLVGNEINGNYKVAEQINSDYDASEFLKHISVYTENMSMDEKIAFAKTVFYIVKKK